MKCPSIALLLLLNLASAATCISILDSIDSLDPSNYADSARLGEIYSNAGKCFSLEGDARKAADHYKLSGDYYFNASELFNVAGDYEKQLIWYMSSGDAYLAAGRRDLAKESFEKAKNIYNQHPDLDPSYSAQISMKLHDSSHRMPEDYTANEKRQDYFQYAALGIGLLVIFGIGLMIIHIGK